jgi:hypothetical protein
MYIEALNMAVMQESACGSVWVWNLVSDIKGGT